MNAWVGGQIGDWVDRQMGAQNGWMVCECVCEQMDTGCIGGQVGEWAVGE